MAVDQSCSLQSPPVYIQVFESSLQASEEASEELDVSEVSYPPLCSNLITATRGQACRLHEAGKPSDMLIHQQVLAGVPAQVVMAIGNVTVVHSMPSPSQ